MTRQPESEAMRAARVELTGIAGELRAVRVRVRALARRLNRAAKGAEVVATGADGQAYTVEGWVGGALSDYTKATTGLSEAVSYLAWLARGDHRQDIIQDV